MAVDSSTLGGIVEAMEESIGSISAEYEWDQIPPMTPEEIAGREIWVLYGAERNTLIATRPFLEDYVWTLDVTYLDEEHKIHRNFTKTMYRDGVTRHFQRDIDMSHADANGRGMRESLQGVIRSDKPSEPALNRTPLGFSVLKFTWDDGIPLSTQLRWKDCVTIDNGIAVVNGFKTIRADIGSPVYERGYILKRVYFAVDFGYTPVRYTFMGGVDANGRDRVAFIADVNSLEQVANGLWFPSSGVIRRPYDPRIDRYRATKPIVLNEAPNDSLFSVEFPPGTEVSDKIVGKRYIVRPTEQQIDQTVPEK